MREVNFSIPYLNKASVNITTTLYDRRALDCTSVLPLINSLNHLAYLTTSSARIRDILTVDGGIERLVSILKEGRSKDVMEMWKWSLAFQCVVNSGVRGSENIRTRVVEADMVPVIATLLDNYIKVMEKVRARTDQDAHRHSSRTPKQSRPDASRTPVLDSSSNSAQRSSRRHPPPSIEIPQPFVQNNTESAGQEVRSHRSNNSRHAPTNRRFRTTAVPHMDSIDGFGVPPVHDAQRLPDILTRLQTDFASQGLASQPESPTSPNPHGSHGQLRPVSQLRPASQSGPRRARTPINLQGSNSAESDDANGDDSAATGDENGSGEANEPVVDVQNQMDIDDSPDNRDISDMSHARGLTVTDQSEGQDSEGFISHHSTVNGAPRADGSLVFPPNETANNQNSPSLAPNLQALYLRDRSTVTTQNVLTMMPRDEDVLMSLQLLAYVSKYCYLRGYFQNSHLVPRLKIDRELQMLDEAAGSSSPVQNEMTLEEEEDMEYILPNDFNIFPLVEKFTVRHHSKDMQYWACVVMRNLCRKDDSRGGIRQCAYYKCGKWEEYQRQFAKCRRCRRTKYCSKDCQKAAWTYHRHWCHTSP